MCKADSPDTFTLYVRFFNVFIGGGRSRELSSIVLLTEGDSRTSPLIKSGKGPIFCTTAKEFAEMQKIAKRQCNGIKQLGLAWQMLSIWQEQR